MLQAVKIKTATLYEQKVILFLQLLEVSGRECYVQKKVILQLTKTSLYVLKEAFRMLRIVPMISKASGFRHAIDQRNYVQAVYFFKGPLAVLPFEVVLTRSTVCVPPPRGILVAGRRKRTRFGSVLHATLARKVDVLLLDQDPFLFSCALVVSMVSEHQTWMDGVGFVSGPTGVVVGASHSPLDGGVLGNCTRGGRKLGSMGTTHRS